MTSHAIRKTTKRRAVQGSVEENHEAEPRIEQLNFVQPGVACDPLELERRASKLRLTSAERTHLSDLWHRAGNGVFFDTLLARLAN
jgi:hypothetical protein